MSTFSRVSAFYDPLQVKNVAVGDTVTDPADSGKVKLYFKDSKLTYKLSTGSEVSLSSGFDYRAANGTVSATAYGFTDNAGTGLYRDVSGTEFLGVAVNGSNVAQFSGTGLIIPGNLTVQGTTTTVDSTVTTIKDNMVIVNSGGVDYNDGGIGIKRTVADMVTDTAFASGTAAGGTTSTIILEADNGAVGYAIKITASGTGGPTLNSTTRITAYDSGTKTATVSPAFDAAPVTDTTYNLYNQVYASSLFHSATKEMQFLYVAAESSSTFTGNYVDGHMNALKLESTLKVADGAVGTPSLAFTTDGSGSGLYYTAPGTVPTVNVATAGVQRLTVSATAVNSLVDFQVATNKMTVAAATGNTLIAGTLDVTGDISATALVKLSAGSAAAPSLTFTADTNTGLYNTADKVIVTTGGKSAVAVYASAVDNYVSRTEGKVGTTTIYDQGTQAVVSAGLKDRVSVTLANSSKYLIEINAYSVSATTGALLCAKLTRLVSTDGAGAITDTPLLGLLEDVSATTWQINTATANTYKLQLYDDNTNAKDFNIKIVVQPFGGDVVTYTLA